MGATEDSDLKELEYFWRHYQLKHFEAYFYTHFALELPSRHFGGLSKKRKRCPNLISDSFSSPLEGHSEFSKFVFKGLLFVALDLWTSFGDSNSHHE